MADKTPDLDPWRTGTHLQISVDVVRDLFRILLEPLERILDTMGGNLHHLETVLWEGP